MIYPLQGVAKIDKGGCYDSEFFVIMFKLLILLYN
jgi:hypothetical protein